MLFRSVDEHQLNHWQHEALLRCEDAALVDWVRGLAPTGLELATVAALRKNILLKADAERWCRRLFGELETPDGEAKQVLETAGPAFFDALLCAGACDYDALVTAAKGAGAKGKGLFQPLRLALTGTLEGPELRLVLALMPPELIRTRFERARALSTV